MKKIFLEKGVEQVKAFLKGYGAESMEGILLYKGPEYFLMGSAAFGLIVCFVCLQHSWYGGALGLLAGMFAPAGLLYISNERDNSQLVRDLKWLYETISVQLQAGLHIGQALVESEGLMKNKRLRTALHRLAEQLISGEDMTSALEQFETSFRNRYISSFCVILRQMQDSGYGVSLLDDIRNQIEEMERMQLAGKKEALEMQLQLFEMLLFIGILVLVMYGCVLAALQNMNFLG